MIVGKATTVIALLILSSSAFAQTQTTGRIAGTVKDQKGAVIIGAEVTVVSKATGDERKVTTDGEGNYAVPFLPPGTYRIRIAAKGFNTKPFVVQVFITETTQANADLIVAGVIVDPVEVSIAPLVQRDGPQLGRVVDSRAVSELPLATRNFTQILGLSPGATVDLPDNTAVGRNSQNASVNGARSTQNNFQINGVNALSIHTNSTTTGGSLAVPAPESIQEFKVQTSLYDATFGRSGGGNIQAVTKSGNNDFHGAAYEYFRDDALNANNPFLKAAGVKRPVLKRNVFGALLGGRIKKDKLFFFGSYQGTRERNGASANSLSSNVLIARGLTDDRSEQTLRRAFDLLSINPISLALLNVKLASGQFLIPTPQVNGRYSGSAPSRFREDQFNTNLDYRINERDWLAVKFFFSNAPTTFALPANGGNVPGFSNDQEQDNRIISLQDVYAFNSRLINEARIGYNFIRQDNFTQAPVKDSDVGIRRANANAFPGLPLIRIAPGAGGVTFGSPSFPDSRNTVPSITAADTLSITRRGHSIRTGAEVIYYQHNFTSNQNSRGGIDFQSFTNFLSGVTFTSVLGTGISERSLRAADYNLFVQDDWKVSPNLTLNLGLRYELDLPPYDTRGRLATFDPTLYKPRPVVVDGIPRGPPIGGFVQAGNVIAQYNLPDLPKVNKRVVNSIDPNNFAPRLGFAYSPLDSGRLVWRGGYGIFYSRVSNLYLFTTAQLAPFYVTGRRMAPVDRPPFADPF
ncbi:MAG TPA: TonB-dependent receptor, partial [Blastocatellia bacterium]|nr:TonB-dependent receptor [Blastocatellia bacterium]